MPTKFTPDVSQIPYGLCHCGCGNQTTIQTRSHSARGLVKGQPARYLPNHVSSNPHNLYAWIQEAIAKHGDSNECLTWNFATVEGYGIVRIPGVGKVLVHRLAFKIRHGRWPEPCGLHECDNPPCFNPKHIFEGTRSDNNADKMAKGRMPPMQGERNSHAILTDENVRQIRRMYATGQFRQMDLAEKFGVCKQSIQDIVLKRSWTHIP